MHPALSTYLKRKDERTVEIVQFEQQQEYKPHRIGPAVGEPPKEQHGDENRRFHQHPAEAVADGRPPFGLIELPVSGVDEEKTDEHDYGNHCHYDQEYLEDVQ